MTTIYTFVSEPSEKFPPQGRQILEAIKAFGGPVNRKDLIAHLNGLVSSGTITTRQTAGKLLGYYQPRMLEAGLITVEKEQVEKKPKKAKKTVAEAA